MKYSKEDLRQIFQRPFDREAWKGILRNLFKAAELRREDEEIETLHEDEHGWFLGQLTTSDNGKYKIGLFRYDVPSVRKRVGLRKLVHSYVNERYGEFDAALVVFNSKDAWRVSFICDIKINGEATAPKRYTFVFGDSDKQYKTAVERFLMLQKSKMRFEDIKNAFSVEALSKDFYDKLFHWYEWASKPKNGITYPTNPDAQENKHEEIHIQIIRLITRLLFVWFIKQKKLVPDELFSPEYLQNILRDFDKDSTTDGCYYNAILQNLFFATLNCPIEDDEGNHRSFASAKDMRDTKNQYRYAEMFSISEEEVIKMFAKVPFLNGGLFECLDKTRGLDDTEYNLLYDGFSRNDAKYPNGEYKYRAFIPNKLFFNDDEKQPGLITLFNQYNFTIEENSTNDAEISLDPELLGRVFENLLAAYNPETKESVRKATGSFYTPRVIVDYMVDEALIAYLMDKKIKGVEEEDLRELFKSHEKVAKWDATQAKAITKALEDIKIIDPACGSGAFPMGCLLRIVDVIETISDDAQFSRYDAKLKIIENCVYGVDIQSIAMLICKLRFFISLICEQKEIDFSNPKENYGVDTLPNLETKFVAANTLISADIREYDNDWMADEKLKALKDELLEIRNRHFLAKGRAAKRKSQRDDEQKRKEIHAYLLSVAHKPNEKEIARLEAELEKQEKLKDIKAGVGVDQAAAVQQTDIFGNTSTLFSEDLSKKQRDEYINNIKAAIAKEKSKGESKGFEKAVKDLTQWDPYDQNSSSDFFDPEWMFCINTKFDVVIGNPPYRQLQKNNGELSNLYKDRGYETFIKKGDIYCLFYERGYQLLKEGGHLCYITSNTWMRSDFGEKTRGFFAKKTNPKILLDFACKQIFDNVTVNTNILLFAKATNEHKTLSAMAIDKYKNILGSLSYFMKKLAKVYDFPNSDTWVVFTPTEEAINRKIEAVGTPLKEWDIKINRGVLTGCNDAFIITTEQRNEILSNCETEEERKRTEKLIQPILQGKDIKRYRYEWADKWLIYIPWHFPYQNDKGIKGASEKAEQAFKELCPTVYNHLLQYKDALSERNKAETGIRYEWYALQRWAANYWEDFSKPKIVWASVGKTFYSAVEEEMFLLDTSYFLTLDDNKYYYYLLGILNSNLIRFWIKKRDVLVSEDRTYRHYKYNFESLSVPIIEDVSNIEEIVLQLLHNFHIGEDYSEYEKELNKEVYKLYNLSPDEIEYMEAMQEE